MDIPPAPFNDDKTVKGILANRKGDPHLKLKPIAEQVVVIVGASSGIGRDTALQFAARGAKVVAVARSESGLQSLVQEIQRQGGDAVYVVADVAEYDQVQTIAEQAVTAYGRIDTWVHMAAVSVYGPLEKIPHEEFHRVIEVDLLGQVYGAMVALPYLKKEGRGALIHITSVLGKRAVPLQSAYDAAKHGVTGMLDALRVELKHEGTPISVTNILPASMNTPLFDKARTHMGVGPRPMPPVYNPRLTTQAILFAAEHPRREIIVGGGGKFILLLEKLWPPLIDAYFLMAAYKGQMTDQPKSPTAPNSLFNPIQNHNRIEGNFTGEARDWSLYTWLELHPLVKYAALGALIGSLATLKISALLLYHKKREKEKHQRLRQIGMYAAQSLLLYFLRRPQIIRQLIRRI